MTRQVVALVLLTGVYCFTLASFQSWDVAIGAGLAAAVLAGFRRFLFGAPGAGAPGPSMPTRALWFLPFCWGVTGEVVRGTWQVARVVLGLAPLRRPGIVAVPMGERTRLGAVVSGIATTLSPGTLLIDFDWDERTMLIHVLDASDPDAVRADLQAFYERYQQRVFP